jgi:hypothetical protein
MKKREWHISYKSWKDYQSKEPAAFSATEARCRRLNNGDNCQAWPECFTWAMWCIKHGTDPRLIDGAVEYVLKNQNNPDMKFYRHQNKHAYMTKIICDETNKSLVDEGRWEEVKAQDKLLMKSIGAVVDRTMQTAKISMLEQRIRELEGK